MEGNKQEKGRGKGNTVNRCTRREGEKGKNRWEDGMRREGNCDKGAGEKERHAELERKGKNDGSGNEMQETDG